MRIDIISVLPELMESPFKASILKRAMDKGLAEIHFHQLRDFGLGNTAKSMTNLTEVELEW